MTSTISKFVDKVHWITNEEETTPQLTFTRTDSSENKNHVNTTIDEIIEKLCECSEETTKQENDEKFDALYQLIMKRLPMSCPSSGVTYSKYLTWSWMNESANQKITLPNSEKDFLEIYEPSIIAKSDLSFENMQEYIPISTIFVPITKNIGQIRNFSCKFTWRLKITSPDNKNATPQKTQALAELPEFYLGIGYSKAPTYYKLKREIDYNESNHTDFNSGDHCTYNISMNGTDSYNLVWNDSGSFASCVLSMRLDGITDILAEGDTIVIGGEKVTGNAWVNHNYLRNRSFEIWYPSSNETASTFEEYINSNSSFSTITINSGETYKQHFDKLTKSE